MGFSLTDFFSFYKNTERLNYVVANIKKNTQKYKLFRPLYFLKDYQRWFLLLNWSRFRNSPPSLHLTLWLWALQEPCVPVTCFPFHFPRGGMKKLLIAAWHLNSLKGYYNMGGGDGWGVGGWWYRISLIGLLWAGHAIWCWGAEIQQLIDNHCLPLKVNHTPQTTSPPLGTGSAFHLHALLK